MSGRSGRREVGALVVASMVTWAMIGHTAILVMATLSLVVLVEGLRRASSHAALGATACLLLAAVGTVVEKSLSGEPRLQFATDRPFTAAVGSLAGGLLLGALVLGWAAPDETSPQTTGAASSDGSRQMRDLEGQSVESPRSLDPRLVFALVALILVPRSAARTGRVVALRLARFVSVSSRRTRPRGS